MTWWISPAVFLVSSILAWVAVSVTAEDIYGVSKAFHVLLPIIIVTSGLALLIPLLATRKLYPQSSNRKTPEQMREFSNFIHQNLRPSRVWNIWFLSVSVAYFIILVLRLILGANHWDPSYPSFLDFGPVYGEGNAGINVAFLNENNSYTHAIQGVFAALLAYPAVKATLFPCPSLRKFYSWLDVTGAVLHVYPTYNLIKRTCFPFYPMAFAGSVFSSNGLEWAFAYTAGVAIAFFLTSIAKVRFLSAFAREQDGAFDNQGSVRGQVLQFGQNEPNESFLFGKGPRIVVFLFGIVTTTSIFLTALLCGVTWNNCKEQNDNTCVNYQEGLAVGIIITLVAVPTVFFFYAIVRECAGGKKEKDDWSVTVGSEV